MASSVGNVIDSYEARVKMVGALMRKTVELLKRFDQEQEQKMMELRQLLANTESLRRKDFDSLMAGIRAQRREKEEKIASHLDSFLKEQERLVAWLRNVTVCGDIGLAQFKLLSQDCLTWQKQAEAELSRMLRELHMEQEELGSGLHQLLQKGETLQVKDFKALVRVIRLRQEGRQNEVSRVLDELWEVDEGVATQWHGVMSSTRA